MRARCANVRRRQAQITGQKPELGESIAIFEGRWRRGGRVARRRAHVCAGRARRPAAHGPRAASRRRCRAAGRAR
ncbi:hypothetical protein DIE18_11880 [Burkholderia sp. Bp9125]|nr:hypothetical protein DIE18_11880 [Burkholderia sp. Bp9125]